jgi:integrase
MSTVKPEPALNRQEFVFAPADGSRLPCPHRGVTEYIEESTGLRLRVTARGARAWYVSYWSPVAKTQRRLKLGNAATVKLSEARGLARAALEAVDRGGDPYFDRRGARELERQVRRERAGERHRRALERRRRVVKFADVCDSYVEWRRTMPGGRFKRKASPRTLDNWQAYLKHISPVVGETPVEDITVDVFVRVLERAVKNGGPSMGPRVREFVAAVWNWMEARTRLLGVTLPAQSPMRELPRDIGSANKDRDRNLSPAEVWRLWRATGGEEDLAGLALRFMLLTAARVKEVTDLPRTELDLAAKVWKLPAARNKGGRDRLIPLSDQAVAVLTRARTAHDGADVFGGVRVAEHMNRVRGAMGGEPWQPRDLRRTAATLCARNGADPFTVALVLGHANPDERMPAVTRTYLRWSYEDKVRATLERLGEWVEETVTAAGEPGVILLLHPHAKA